VSNRRSGFRGSRSTKERGQNVWTTVLSAQSSIATGVTIERDIVADSDWSTTAGTSRATLMRIRGYFSVIHKLTTGSFADAPVLAYIAIFDEDETSPAATDVNTYSDEDVIWTAGHLFAFADTGTVGPTWQQEIDVKAQRKIKNGQEVRLVITNAASISVSVTLVVRALLRRGA